MSKAPDPKDMGRLYALAQVGMEMVVPIGLGVTLDYWLGWTPWATVAGAVLGFAGGLIHLVMIVNKDSGNGPSKPRAGSP